MRETFKYERVITSDVFSEDLSFVDVGYIFDKTITIDANSMLVKGSFDSDLKVADGDILELFSKEVFKHKSPVLYDIGACTGSYSMLGLFNSKIITYAFEPVTKSRQCLINNVNINGLSDRVYISDCAISNYNGIGRFNIVIHDGCKALSMLNGKPAGHKKCYVKEAEVRKLDEIVELPPTAIKIDAEGGELNVLKGAIKTLEKYKPIVLCEYSHENANQYGYDPNDINDLLSELGYLVTIKNNDLLAL